MKKTFLSICSVAFLTLTTMIACNKNSSLDENLPNNNNTLTSTSTLIDCNITGLENSLFTDDLEKNVENVGKLHNEAMTAYFNSVTQHGHKLEDQPNFDNHLRTTLESFFESKGVKLDEGNIYPCVNSAQQSLWGNSDYQTEFSSQAQQIINKVVNLFNNEAIEIPQLLTDLKTLKTQAYTLKNTGEKSVVLAMIVVGINSVEYWNEHIQDWSNYFGDDEELNGVNKGFSTLSGKQTSKSAVLKKVGVSDAIGALRGGIGGLGLGGPVGAFAGALVGAGVNSCMRAIFYGATKM